MSDRPGLKRNVEVFDSDAAHGCYRYTDQGRLSSALSNARMTRAIRDIVDFTDATVLDVGCGDGTYTIELAGSARSIVGIDPAPTAIALAESKASAAAARNVSFHVGDVYALDVPGRFDIAVFRGVLHHLPDPAAAVRNVAQRCRQMVILEPNGWNPVLKVIERVSPYHRAHEEQSFLPLTVKRWIAAAGGRTAAVHVVNLIPMFCPDPLARACKVVEPWVEALPGVRTLACAQVVILAQFARGSSDQDVRRST